LVSLLWESTDVDLGVKVASWGQFEQLTDSLIATGEFTSSPERQRVLFGTLPIDMIQNTIWLESKFEKILLKIEKLRRGFVERVERGQ